MQAIPVQTTLYSENLPALMDALEICLISQESSWFNLRLSFIVVVLLCFCFTKSLCRVAHEDHLGSVGTC